MCGIAGFISVRVSPLDRHAAVERMNAAMLHRGPDDSGLISDGPATLGMRRLAIFDPAHGHQPMSTPDGRHHLVFNGALYNFRELRAELASLGHTFRTNCDTEVLLAAYAHWGEKCLPRLRGMFAFAVWDSREQTLFLARDPLGIKPLYYSLGSGTSSTPSTFLFASELRALLASGHCSDAIAPGSVNACLAYLAPHAPATIYRDARSLRPGECATFKNNQLQVRAYWTFRDATSCSSDSALQPFSSSALPPPASTRSEFISQLRAQLDDSIRAHTLADVPVGAFLSGGLDSGVIAALMARQQGAKLKTFSIGFAESAFSEAAEAAATAAYLGTEHTALVLSGEQVAADLPRILAAFDQPTGDAVNTWYASQLARAGGVTVALSGLGGDELFGGYPWFRSTPRLARWLPLWRSLPSALQRPLLAQLRRGRTRRQKLADFLEHARDLHSLAALQRRNFSERQRTALLSPDLAATFPFTEHPELAHLRDELPHSSASGSATDPFSIISAWELRTYMADVLLRDSDVMSMSHSLELRVPFVDRPLLEWLWRQPARFKDDRASPPKSVVAEAARDILPPELLTRRKRGFTLPFALWMRGPLRPFLDETFSESSIARSGFFNTPAVQAHWKTFLARDLSRDWSRLWSLAVLITFVNRR